MFFCISYHLVMILLIAIIHCSMKRGLPKYRFRSSWLLPFRAFAIFTTSPLASAKLLSASTSFLLSDSLDAAQAHTYESSC